MQSNSRSGSAKLGPREHAIYFGALAQGKAILTTEDAARLGGLPRGRERKVLHALHRKGVLLRAAKGV